MINWGHIYFLVKLVLIFFIPTIIVIVMKLTSNIWWKKYIYHQDKRIELKSQIRENANNYALLKEIKKEERLEHFYNFLYDFSEFEYFFAQLNFAVSVIANFIIFLIVIINISTFVNERKIIENWNHTIKYYNEHVEYPTSIEIQEAEKLNNEIKNLSFYKNTDKLPKIDTEYLWEKFIENKIQRKE